MAFSGFIGFIEVLRTYRGFEGSWGFRRSMGCLPAGPQPLLYTRSSASEAQLAVSSGSFRSQGYQFLYPFPHGASTRRRHDLLFWFRV